jgi:hypothetical protein
VLRETRLNGWDENKISKSNKSGSLILKFSLKPRMTFTHTHMTFHFIMHHKIFFASFSFLFLNNLGNFIFISAPKCHFQLTSATRDLTDIIFYLCICVCALHFPDHIMVAYRLSIRRRKFPLGYYCTFGNRMVRWLHSSIGKYYLTT